MCLLFQFMFDLTLDGEGLIKLVLTPPQISCRKMLVIYVYKCCSITFQFVIVLLLCDFYFTFQCHDSVTMDFVQTLLKVQFTLVKDLLVISESIVNNFEFRL